MFSAPSSALGNRMNGRKIMATEVQIGEEFLFETYSTSLDTGFDLPSFTVWPKHGTLKVKDAVVDQFRDRSGLC